MTDELKRDGDTGRNAADPTMEEILASIRRIIAEDGDKREDGAEAGGAADGARVADILDLTEMVADDGSVVSLAPHPDVPEVAPYQPPQQPAVPLLEPDPAPLQNFVAPVAAPASPYEEPSSFEEKDQPMTSAVPPRDPLVSEPIASQARNAFAQVAEASRPSLPPRAPTGDARTVEQVTEDLLRPMLKAWLDANLPALVERAVQEELARISGRGPGF